MKATYSFGICSVLAVLLVGSAAFATAPGVIDVEFVGDLCELDGEVRLGPGNGGGYIDIDYGVDFGAVTSPADDFDREKCDVYIDLEIPYGYRLALHSLGYEGDARVPPDGRATIITRYRLAGETQAGLLRDFYQTTTFEGEQPLESVWTYCGEDVTLKATTILEAERGPNAGAQTRIYQTSGVIDTGPFNTFWYVLEPCCPWGNPQICGRPTD
jgi:hypothetical protein